MKHPLQLTQKSAAAEGPAAADSQPHAIDGSPRMVAQAKHLARVFGPAAQRFQARAPTDVPTAYMRRWIDPAKGSATAAEYGAAQYGINRERAVGIVDKIVASLEKHGPGGDTSLAGAYAKPDPAQWNVTPDLSREAKIPGYGLKIQYDHKTLKNEAKLEVRYHTVFKRNAATGKVDLSAVENRAPTAKDRAESKDPIVKMNLNLIWANQMQDFLNFEKAAAKSGSGAAPGGKLGSVKRSQIENPSTLATLWMTTRGGAGTVEDKDDWLALSGSPNGFSVLYMIMQTPGLGEELDAKAVKADPSALYEIDVEEDEAGASMKFK